MVIAQKTFNQLWMGTIVLLLVTQYIRPQDFLGLYHLSLFTFVAGVVLLFMFFNKHSIYVFAHSQIRLIALYVCWMIFLVPFAQLPGKSIHGLMNFIPLLPFVFSIPLIINDIKSLHKVVDTFILLSIIISLIGILTGGGRYVEFGLGNFLTDPNDYALYMNTMLPICFFMFMYERTILKRVFYGIAIILSLSSIIISYSRGGFLALLCISVIMWWFSPNKKVTALLGLILLLSVVLFSSNQWKDTVSTSFDSHQHTAQTRLTTWKLSFKAFIDHPMGIGMNNIPGVMYRYANSAENPNRWWGDVNHSFWLTSLAEGGIIGFILILLLLINNIFDCLQMIKVKPLNNDLRFIKYFGYAYFGSIVGFCTAGTFLTVNYYPHLWYISGIVAAGGGVLYQAKKNSII